MLVGLERPLVKGAGVSVVCLEKENIREIVQLHGNQRVVGSERRLGYRQSSLAKGAGAVQITQIGNWSRESSKVHSDLRMTWSECAFANGDRLLAELFRVYEISFKSVLFPEETVGGRNLWVLWARRFPKGYSPFKSKSGTRVLTATLKQESAECQRPSDSDITRSQIPLFDTKGLIARGYCLIVSFDQDEDANETVKVIRNLQLLRVEG